MSETTIKNVGGGQSSYRNKSKIGGKSRLGKMHSNVVLSSRGGSSHVIVDDY